MRQSPATLKNVDAVEWLTAIEQEAILRFKREVSALFGGVVEQVILFGSRARGQGHEESDIDLAVVLSEDEQPFWRRIVDVATDLNLDYEYRVRVSPLILSREKLLALWSRERAIAEAILVEGIKV